jgi:hypothetical protein
MKLMKGAGHQDTPQRQYPLICLEVNSNYFLKAYFHLKDQQLEDLALDRALSFMII